MISQQSYYTSYYNGSSFWALKYTYCANNPMKFVDPTGEEVEFNSIIDVVYTFCERIVNKDFRSKFNELKKSDETYVFNFNTEAKNSLTTDGEKLFINYSDKR